MIPTPDWDEACTLTRPDGQDRDGTLADLVLLATRLEPDERPEYVLVSRTLGEVDNEQLEALRRRPDFPVA